MRNFTLFVSFVSGTCHSILCSIYWLMFIYSFYICFHMLRLLLLSFCLFFQDLRPTDSATYILNLILLFSCLIFAITALSLSILVLMTDIYHIFKHVQSKKKRCENSTILIDAFCVIKIFTM